MYKVEHIRDENNVGLSQAVADWFNLKATPPEAIVSVEYRVDPSGYALWATVLYYDRTHGITGL